MLALLKSTAFLPLPTGKVGEGKDLTLRQVFYLNSEATEVLYFLCELSKSLLPQATCKGVNLRSGESKCGLAAPVKKQKINMSCSWEKSPPNLQFGNEAGSDQARPGHCPHRQLLSEKRNVTGRHSTKASPLPLVALYPKDRPCTLA